MGKEESPQITRRSTRSSSLAAITSNEVETAKVREPDIPTVADLAFKGAHLSFDELLSIFPGRRNQILEVMRLLGPLNCPMLPLFIYGGGSTGKTSIVLQIFRHLNRPFVYASCCSCYGPRILFECILNQLFLHRRCSVNGYPSAKRCEKPSDFVNFLRDALLSVIDTLKCNSTELSAKKLSAPSNGSMLYFVFDSLELVREWDKSSSMLSLIFNLHNILKMPEVGFILISNTSPDTYYSVMGYVEPTPVYFPEYTEEDLRQIFLRNQANRKLYSSFLDIVLRPFCRITRRVDDLSTAFSLLFSKYCEPLNDLESAPNEELKRKLFSHFKPHIAPALNETFWVPSRVTLEVEPNGETRKKERVRKSEGGDEITEIDFHMSTAAKYLLISAFLASRNPATLDASLFDSTGGSSSQKRKRKASDKSMEQKETAEYEFLLKGPGTFPLERLLAIFQCITSVGEGSLVEEDNGNDIFKVKEDNGLMADVLLQLSSLCNANFIAKGGSCTLEGSTRYRSTLSEDLALKVARSLKFPLANYLYRQ